MNQCEKDLDEIQYALEKDMMLSVFFGKSKEIVLEGKICKEAKEITEKAGYIVDYVDGNTRIKIPEKNYGCAIKKR